MGDSIFETNIMGSGTNQHGRRAIDCPSMAAAGLESVGFGDMGKGYYSGRLKPSFSHLACCYSGAGEVYCGGSWSPFEPGLAVIQPAGFAHAARSLDGRPFSFFWVVLSKDSAFLRSELFARPCRLERDSAAAAGALRELCASGMGRRAPSARLEESCVRLLSVWIEELLSCGRGERRLDGLWQEVARKLGRKWSAASLARLAGVSPTHLRRLCAEECGMSPMKRLSLLRVEQAKTLMSVSGLKLDAVAERLGYANMFAFSAAFKRAEGVSPSFWREKAGRPS